jgi:hypothetical protein
MFMCEIESIAEPVLVGHSLGAGVATLAGILLSERMPNISVFAFAPPCCVDVETAKSHWCREHVVSVVNEVQGIDFMHVQVFTCIFARIIE